MSVVTEEMVEAVAEAIYTAKCQPNDKTWADIHAEAAAGKDIAIWSIKHHAKQAHAALAAVAPLIAKAERERCAVMLEAIADRVEPPGAKRVNQVDRHTAGILRDKAAAIRALKEGA